MDTPQATLGVIGGGRVGKTSLCHAIVGFPALPTGPTVTRGSAPKLQLRNATKATLGTFA